MNYMVKKQYDLMWQNNMVKKGYGNLHGSDGTLYGKTIYKGIR